VLSFTDQEIADQAVQLGLIEPGEPVPPHLRSRVAAALAHNRPAAPQADAARVAASIIVRPGSGIEIDGRPFPWVVQAASIEVALDPSGKGTVRLTVPTQSVQILKPESEQR
jgi:hypothetical protein